MILPMYFVFYVPGKIPVNNAVMEYYTLYSIEIHWVYVIRLILQQ